MKSTLLTLSVSLAAATALATPATEMTSWQTPRVMSGISNLPVIDRCLGTETEMNRPMHAPATDDLSMMWGYAEDPYSPIMQGVGEVKMAVKVEDFSATYFADQQITGLVLYSPYPSSGSTQPIKQATIWLSESLDGDPFMTATGTLDTKALTGNFIEFETPYTIEAGKPFFMGVTVNVPANQSGLSVYLSDGYVGTGNSAWVYSKLKGYSNGSFLYYDNPQWSEWSNTYGNVCLYANITGPDLPVNEAGMYTTSLPVTVSTGQPFSFNTAFVNMGANGLSEIEYTLEIEGQAPQSVTMSAQNPFYYNQAASGNLTFQCDVEGYEIPWKLYISKLNGDSPNLYNPNGPCASLHKYGNVMTGTVNSLSDGYQSYPVCEEFTGTGCGWCPRGLYGMDYMAEHFGDLGFIGIAVHSSMFGTDPMASMDKTGQAYYNITSGKVNGLPMAIFNRNFKNSLDPNWKELTSQFENLIQYPSIAKISAKAELIEENTKINFTTVAEFAFDIANNGRYKIAQTIIENNVGPYSQRNYYAGYSDAQSELAPGWNTKKDPVATRYNDVARNCSRPGGYANSLPASLVKGEKYEYSKNVTLSEIKNVENCKFIAYIIDTTDGSIVNATECNFETAGVEGIADNRVDARAGKGFIELGQNADVVAVDGRVMARNAQGRVELPAGIYIVNGAKLVVR